MAKNTSQSTDLKSSLGQLEKTLELYLRQKAPSLPENIKELIVTFAPWLTITVLVFSLPAVLFAVGLGSVVLPFSYLGGFSAGLGMTASLIVLIASLILMIAALPGLFKRSAGAWRLMYYSALVSALYNLVRFNLGGLIIGTLISLYILFQIKEYYK